MISLTRRQLAYLGASLVLIGLCAPFSRSLNRQRIAHGMTPSEVKAGVDPTTFLGTFVLAGFRPLVVNYLWIKASSLQQRKEYWELRSVYELLSKLQPHNPEVWVFNSWNMGYNISVEMAEDDDRWRWIKAAIDFIQRGRRLNPKGEVIHDFEGQLFYQKIWQLPWLRDRVYRAYGKSALDLAEQAVWRAYELPHNPSTCLWLRVILVRKARVALAERADVAEALRLFAQINAVSAHIPRVHPHVKFVFERPVLREELVEAAGLFEFTVFASIRRHLRDLRGLKHPPADWQQRWNRTVAILDQVARCYSLLDAELDATERSLRGALREALERTEDPLERLVICGLAAQAGRWLADWRLFSKVMHQTTLARKAWQPLVARMYALPRHEQAAFRIKHVRPVLQRTFRGPLGEAIKKIRTGSPHTTPLRLVMAGRAASLRD